MNPPPSYVRVAAPTHLFVLRVWLESLDTDRSEWRGELKCLANGEVCYFRDWHTLISHLIKLLSELSKGARR
ncbi:MAG: hypothetical protein LC737_06060 [Chloroflexi bacterium]|nr:hypothetical protein [Chloroflexota bacterium]